MSKGSRVPNQSTTGYGWGGENRMTSVTLPNNGGAVTFKYDPFGRRIYKSSPSGTTIYVYDGANVLEERDGAGTWQVRYTQGPGVDEPLAMVRGGDTSYYQADGLGSVTSLTNGSGTIIASYTYDSYGKITNTTGTIVNPFRYTGREWDAETGLYYYRARYYDPQTGRFLNEDPIRFGGGINFFRYASNNPIMRTDPLGLYDGNQLLRDTGTFAEAFADTLTFDSASRLNNALGAGSAVDRCSWIHTAGTVAGVAASIPLGGEAFPAGLKWLPNGAKGFIGEGLSIGKNLLGGGRLIGLQVDAAELGLEGLTTKFDSVWELGGEQYYVESKFGTSTLTDPQKLAQATLGAAYHVERWGYPFFGRVGNYLGGAAGIVGGLTGGN